VFDSKGACKGTTARYIAGSTKARSWIEDYEQVMWLKGAERSNYLFIVEGLLDGLKMCSYGDVLVLLGTSMNQNTMQEVSRVFNKNPKLKIVWLLDPDATNKAMLLQHHSKLYFHSFVVMLNADPKDADKAYLDTCFK
jgi:DNA primase